MIFLAIFLLFQIEFPYFIFNFLSLALSILASNMPNADDIVVEDAVPPPVYIQMILPIAVFMFSVSYGAGMGPAIYTWSSELFSPR